ncbi:MAG: hypothetical protein LIP23_00575 [Planctomycetes bacterium]|nr:hypothetical protein [Planctomycetota bacterium]
MTDSTLVDFEAHYLDAGLFELMKDRDEPPSTGLCLVRIIPMNGRLTPPNSWRRWRWKIGIAHGLDAGTRWNWGYNLAVNNDAAISQAGSAIPGGGKVVEAAAKLTRSKRWA